MLLLSILMAPPDDPWSEKWLGLGISTPSMRHNNPLGEFPRITISLLASLDEATPA